VRNRRKRDRPLWRTVALAAAVAAAAAVAPGAEGATRLFIVNHVSSNDVRHVAPWGGRLAIATGGGLVLADTASAAISKVLRASGALPSDNLLAVVESPSGLLWIGTADRGMARLRPDGTSLRTLTSFDGLPTDRVQAVVRSGDSLWVATSGGVALFTEAPSNGQFSLRRSDSRASTAGAIVSDDVTSLAVWGDTLWIGTGGGISTFAGGAWAARPGVSTARVQALTVARDTLWIGTKTGLLAYAGGAVSARGGTVETLSLATIGSSVLQGTVSGPTLHEPSGAATSLGTGGLVTSGIQAAAVTPTGRMLVGTNAGLASFAGGAVPWQMIPFPGPVVNGGSRIAANARGAWVSLGNAAPPGGESGNVLHYDGAAWSRLTAASTGGNLQASGLIALFASSDGRLWMGHCCSAGIGGARPRTDRWDPATDTWDIPAAYNMVDFAEAPSGRIYGVGVQLENGVYVFDGASAALLDSLTPDNTGGGLTRNNLRGVVFDTAGRGWFATADNGVDRWDGRGTDTHADDVWTHFASGFPNVQTTAIAITGSGDVWVGTRAGIARIAGGSVDAATTFAVNTQLGAVSVNALAVDAEQGVWIATADGLTRVGETGAIERFDVTDGLASSDVLALAWDGGRRVLWALTAGGVSEIHPDFSNRFSFDDGSYVYPNPATAATTVVRLGGIGGELRGEVRDLSGARLHTFRADPTATSIWDLRDAKGDPVAPGIYLVVIRQGDLSRVLRLAVTR